MNTNEKLNVSILKVFKFYCNKKVFMLISRWNIEEVYGFKLNLLLNCVITWDKLC